MAKKSSRVRNLSEHRILHDHLAMHSAYETAGSKDTEYLIKALQLFYGKAIKTEADGVYKIV